MNYEELKKKLISILENEIESITSNLLMEAEDGTEFTFAIGEKIVNVEMNSIFDEKKFEYIEKYEIK